MIGQMRARALHEMDAEARLAAVADPREDRARAIAGTDHCICVYSDGIDIARDGDLDAVVLSTPPALREAIAIACIKAGKHLLCEKPLAATLRECRHIVEAAEDVGVCLATGFTLRHTPAARLAWRLVKEGAIGELDHMRAFHGHRGGRDFGPAWITDHAMTGGGTLMDNGIHMIDLARWFLGDVDKVAGFASNHIWKKARSEDNGFLLLRSQEGRIAALQSSWTEWRGYGYRVELYGSRGAIRFSYPPLWLTHWQGKPGQRMTRKDYPFLRYQIMERLRGWQWSLVETLVADFRDWFSAIRSGNPAPSSGHDGLEAVRIAQSTEFCT
jgi:predicted dehydrogenase